MLENFRLAIKQENGVGIGVWLHAHQVRLRSFPQRTVVERLHFLLGGFWWYDRNSLDMTWLNPAGQGWERRRMSSREASMEEKTSSTMWENWFWSYDYEKYRLRRKMYEYRITRPKIQASLTLPPFSHPATNLGRVLVDDQVWSPCYSLCYDICRLFIPFYELFKASYHVIHVFIG